MSEQKFKVIRKEYSHTSRIISIEDLLKINHILVAKTSSHVEAGLELSEIFAAETDSIHISTINFGGTFIWTITKLLGRIAESAGILFVDERTGLLFVSDLPHGHV